MSKLVHHKQLSKKPRAKKYQSTQLRANAQPPKAFEENYTPKYLHVVYDTETTGFVSRNVEIVNIACEVDIVLLQQLLYKQHGNREICICCQSVITEESKDTDFTCEDCIGMDDKQPRCNWFESLVKPTINSTIPKEAIEIHKITDKDVTKAPSIAIVLEEMFEWLVNLRTWYKLPHNFPILLTAHNGHNFDQLVVQLEMLRENIQLPAEVHFGDTRHSIIWGFGYPWTRMTGETTLQKLVRRICLREDFQQTHCAMQDVEALLGVLHNWYHRQDMYEALWHDRNPVLGHKQLLACIDETTQEKKYSSSVQQSSNSQPKRKYTSDSSSNTQTKKYKTKKSSV
jgi:DNA polymerase III epsilon subunit-like protein